MAFDKIEIIVKIIDCWIEDSIDRGFKPMKLYVLLQIGNKITLCEKEIVDEC